ncbi:hypothetical protein OESDEN_10311 [Oesophagostomum dentatum]|uniref:Uncharacterized protein n=1 Tax=Oesophagostomum dentatum TaxID=61180 RepID=A0A0B1T369_OESDE|nr:hypothetical protein OESDEN_10311 [Oesophagostomum dentatum]
MSACSHIFWTSSPCVHLFFRHLGLFTDNRATVNNRLNKQFAHRSPACTSLTMAFITPVVRKDYNLYSTKNCSRDPKRRTSLETSPKIYDTADDPWESSIGRRVRLELMRERRLRHYNRKLQQTHVLRKISEISNESVNEDELVFDRIQNGFTIMRRLTEADETEEKHCHSKENEEHFRVPTSKAHSDPNVGKPSKYGAMLKMFHWMARRHSIRGK